ncbi:hypothetical protein LEMLEM_LOCUS2516, partial [Lemmus lemmus]
AIKGYAHNQKYVTSDEQYTWNPQQLKAPASLEVRLKRCLHFLHSLPRLSGSHQSLKMKPGLEK